MITVFYMGYTVHWLKFFGCLFSVSCQVQHNTNQKYNEMSHLAAFEKVPEYFKRRWLTHRRESLEDRILDASEVVGLELYNLKPLKPRDEQSSLGALGLPPEILRMIFTQLSFHDLQNVKAVNTHIRSHVVSVPEYQRVKASAPALLVALYITNLSECFTISRIYNVLISSQCTVCGRFGAYVFLPGLQRCCQRCAEHDIEFMPISQDTAKKQFGVRNRDTKFLPKLVSREGIYCSSAGEPKKYKGKRVLVSRAEARKFGCNDPGNGDWIAHKDVRAYQRYMALLPLPVLLPKEGSVDRGLHCKGCMVVYEKAPTYCMCAIVMPGGIEDSWDDWDDDVVISKQSSLSCRNELAADQLHSKEGILEPIGGCEEAKALLDDRISILKSSTQYEEVDDIDEFWQIMLEHVLKQKKQTTASKLQQ
ncbi:MAG: hypothetical protein ASARMPREDX12_000539 [Alectoria sarmentosa]|nr:MAG: hypothetical protein ASARMPREDX12_000539 [Alectoria sarmentosa]